MSGTGKNKTRKKHQEGDRMSKRKIFAPLAASNHTDGDRPKDDFYATEPKAAELLLDVETFNRNIWECACGAGHLAQVFTAQGYEVRSSDIIDRGCGDVLDFLQVQEEWAGDIITNPPYKYALEFAEKALEVTQPGAKVALFLKVLFLEGKRRKEFFQKNPPRTVYVSASRLKCAKNGDFEQIASSAVAYAWFVWEKGYQGDTVVKWIN